MHFTGELGHRDFKGLAETCKTWVYVLDVGITLLLLFLRGDVLDHQFRCVAGFANRVVSPCEIFTVPFKDLPGGKPVMASTYSAMAMVNWRIQPVVMFAKLNAPGQWM